MYTCSSGSQDSVKTSTKEHTRVSCRTFHGGRRHKGNVDACKGCMHMLVHLLDSYEILDIFKDKKCQVQL